MIFRWLFVATFVVLLLNLEAVLHVASFNPLEKALALGAGLAFAITRQRLPFVLGGMLAMIGLTFLSALFTRYENFYWVIYFLSLNQIIVPFLFLAARPTVADRDFVLRVVAWLPPFSSVVGFAYSVVGLHSLWAYEWMTNIARFQGSLIPAFFAGFAMCGTIAATLYADLKDRRYLFLAAANFVLLVLSGARGPTSVALIICAAAFFTRFKGLGNVKLGVFFTALFGAFVAINTFAENLLARVENQSLSGRELMWSFLQRVSDEYPNFGVGFGHQITVVPRDIYILTGSNAAHNDFLRSAVEIGQVQSYLFYGVFIVTLLILWHRVYNHGLIMLLGIIGYMGLSYTDNTLASISHFPLLFITAYSCLKEPVHARPENRDDARYGAIEPEIQSG